MSNLGLLENGYKFFPSFRHNSLWTEKNDHSRDTLLMCMECVTITYFSHVLRPGCLLLKHFNKRIMIFCSSLNLVPHIKTTVSKFIFLGSSRTQHCL